MRAIVMIVHGTETGMKRGLLGEKESGKVRKTKDPL